jgi:alpha-amylase/alpha-mannosidase (GH57 family)
MWMPWVRLHGVKDYTGMALLLEEFPEIRCTVNFSPALLDQVLAYGEGVEDAVLAVCRKTPAALSEEERKFLRRQLFFAHPETHIRAIPRYAELHERERHQAPFRDADFLDLETVAALAWIHPLVTARDAELAALRRKGRDFTVAERDRVLAKQLETLAEVVPRWKALQDRGQVEISGSPYYHPILPLLCDFADVRDALPDAPLPKMQSSLADDAPVHARRARERLAALFGRAPAGCWPSEGSVSPAACETLARAGFAWAATDEEILARSLGHPFDRAGINRPWRAGDLAVVFRDQVLSNLVSFTYKMKRAEEAADDFVGRVEAADDGLVVVALDGENPWEHYPGNGVEFLRAVYSRLSGHPRVRTVTMSEGIAAVASERLGRIFSGSWINHSFAVWAGHEEDRRGWEMLGRVRAMLPKEAPWAAWESLYAAEGSDWFWWFGEDYSSPQDAEFDALFRRHLANACALAGLKPPPELSQPVKKRRREDLVRAPWAALNVVLDGRRSDYFEWIAAGHYDLARDFGAMAGEIAFLSDLLFGFDEKRLLVRLDFRPGVRPREMVGDGVVRVVSVAPEHRTVALWPPSAGEAALDEIFEAAVPFEALGASGGEVSFYVEIERPGAPPARIPSLMPITMVLPGRDFDKINWTV